MHKTPRSLFVAPALMGGAKETKGGRDGKIQLRGQVAGESFCFSMRICCESLRNDVRLRGGVTGTVALKTVQVNLSKCDYIFNWCFAIDCSER